MSHSHDHSHSHEHHHAPAKRKGPNGMFVAAVFLMLLAMLAYVLTLDESVPPGAVVPQEAVPADAAP